MMRQQPEEAAMHAIAMRRHQRIQVLVTDSHVQSGEMLQEVSAMFDVAFFPFKRIPVYSYSQQGKPKPTRRDVILNELRVW